jgi:hypothetical protein
MWNPGFNPQTTPKRKGIVLKGLWILKPWKLETKICHSSSLEGFWGLLQCWDFYNSFWLNIFSKKNKCSFPILGSQRYLAVWRHNHCHTSESGIGGISNKNHKTWKIAGYLLAEQGSRPAPGVDSTEIEHDISPSPAPSLGGRHSWSRMERYKRCCLLVSPSSLSGQWPEGSLWNWQWNRAWFVMNTPLQRPDLTVKLEMLEWLMCVI